MLQPAFNTYAGEYDQHFTYTLVGKAQRRLVHDYLEKRLHKNQEVLEINCGTGEDALFIAQRCKSLLATDQSYRMTAIAQEKLQAWTNSEAKSLDINHIAALGKNFDLIFSNFGGINCLDENEVKKLAANANTLLKENGELILVIMPQKCAWETFYFLLKSDFRKAFRRGKGKVTAAINGASFDTYYYSPHKIKAHFSPYFAAVTVLPVGFFVPPSYLNPFFENRPRALSQLENLEKKNRRKFLAPYSDHYLIHLKKKK